MDPLSLMLGLGGIGMNFFGQQQTNQMAAQMMQQQQSFQERMSSTAYQRASADMQAAGLNPMMMFSSGSAASTPAGAAPSANVKSGLDADAFQKAINTGVQARVANATIDNLVEQNAKIKAETLTETRRPQLVSAQTGETDTRARQNIERTKLLEQELPILRNQALTARNEERINATARRIADQAAYLGGKTSATLAPVRDVVSTARSTRDLFRKRFYYDY